MNNNNNDNYSSLHSLSEEEGRGLAKEIPPPTSVEDLANLMQALSDPTRVRIISLLTEEELCVHDLATLIGATQSSISHHLKTLRLNDLVESRRDGKTVYYSLADEHVSGLFKECMGHVDRD
jgi:DNA-binding transcriptional ArsR family regulator